MVGTIGNPTPLIGEYVEFDGEGDDFAFASDFDLDRIAGLVCIEGVIERVVVRDFFIVNADDDIADIGAAIVLFDAA